MVAVPPALYQNLDAVLMQRMLCPTKCMTYVVMEGAVPTEVDVVSLCYMHCTCSAISAVCSAPAMVAVRTALSENVGAVPRHWMQCPTRCMQYVVTEDAVP